MIKLVCFDLDGTLLDTIKDIAYSMNLALKKYGLEENSVEDYIRYVGNGANKITKRSMHQELDSTETKLVMDEYFKNYNEYRMYLTKPFEGMEDTLKYLKKNGIILTAISNKPDIDCKEMIEHYFPDTFSYIRGATEGIRNKPDSEHIDIMLNKFGIKKNEMVYVGDSRVDAAFAENSGVRYFLMEYGYENKELLHSFHPIKFLDKASDLKEALLNVD